PVPDLGRVHAVPTRDLAGLEQKIDGCRMRATLRPRVAKRLAIMAALGMGGKAQLGYDAFGVHVCVPSLSSALRPLTRTRVKSSDCGGGRRIWETCFSKAVLAL